MFQMFYTQIEKRHISLISYSQFLIIWYLIYCGYNYTVIVINAYKALSLYVFTSLAS